MAAAPPRFHLHFIPISSSWLNLVERWFAKTTTKLLWRGSHRTVQALEKDIRSWVAAWNEDPRPYVWTKTVEDPLGSFAARCERVPKLTNKSIHLNHDKPEVQPEPYSQTSK